MSITDRLFQRRNELAAANLKAGNDFLAANGQKPGVTELPSGLQYEVIHMGDGPKPGPASKVTCHYHGTLIDGTMFDSSVKRGVPATFPLNAVIKGWNRRPATDAYRQQMAVFHPGLPWIWRKTSKRSDRTQRHPRI